MMTNAAPLACGCEYVSKYCDQYHWEVNERAKQRRVEDALLAEAMDWFMRHDGAGYAVEALACRRETGAWPDAG